jgi:hypothetical protein
VNKSFRRIAFKHLLVPLITGLFLFIGFSYLANTMQNNYVTMADSGLLWLYILFYLFIATGFICSGFLLVSLITFILSGFPVITEKYKQLLLRDVSTYISLEYFWVPFFPKMIDKISNEFYDKISKTD